MLTLPAPPCCILIPGHCGRCTPSGKPLVEVAGEDGGGAGGQHRCGRLYRLVKEMESSKNAVFMCKPCAKKCEGMPGRVKWAGARRDCVQRGHPSKCECGVVQGCV